MRMDSPEVRFPRSLACSLQGSWLLAFLLGLFTFLLGEAGIGSPAATGFPFLAFARRFPFPLRFLCFPFDESSRALVPFRTCSFSHAGHYFFPPFLPSSFLVSASGFGLARPPCGPLLSLTSSPFFGIIGIKSEMYIF